eukprot:scaffold8_cov249-Pinguiococcus_pyrenoidosus.AAC.2
MHDTSVAGLHVGAGGFSGLGDLCVGNLRYDLPHAGEQQRMQREAPEALDGRVDRQDLALLRVRPRAAGHRVLQDRRVLLPRSLRPHRNLRGNLLQSGGALESLVGMAEGPARRASKFYPFLVRRRVPICQNCFPSAKTVRSQFPSICQTNQTLKHHRCVRCTTRSQRPRIPIRTPHCARPRRSA